MQYILKLDAFRKIPTELTNPTLHGAYLTIMAYTIMALLFFMEFHAYLSTTATKTVELDSHYAQVILITFALSARMTIYIYTCIYDKYLHSIFGSILMW